MQGNLTVNLDPAYIGFVSGKNVRRFRYCSTNELRDLLVDLKIMAPFQLLPNKECIIRLDGDFPLEVLAKFGLARPAVADTKTSPSIGKAS